VLFSPAAATPSAVGNYKQRSALFRTAVERC
jgi:UDP-N-acetylmuramoylalanine-D-glutamate ligase